MENEKPKKQGDVGFGVENYEPTLPEPKKPLTSGPNDEDWKRFLDPARVKRGDPYHRTGRAAETESAKKKVGRPRKDE